MRGIAGLHHHLQLRCLHGRCGEQALVRDFDDIAAAVADLAGDVRQDTGRSGICRCSRSSRPSRSRFRSSTSDNPCVDVAAGDRHCRPSCRGTARDRSAALRRRPAGALGHRLAALDQQADRFLHRAFRHDQDFHAQRRDDANGCSPMSRTAMPSAMVGRRPKLFRRQAAAPWRHMPRPRRHIPAMPGLIAVAAIRQPASNPPPPTGITSTSRSGASCSSSSASVPCPAITPTSS